MTDEELILQYKKTSDKLIISQLFKVHAQSLFGLAYYYLSDKSSSSDIVMEVFEVVLKTVDQKEISNFKGWINGICRRMCLKQLNRQVKTIDIEIIPDSVMEIEGISEYNNKMTEHLRESMSELNHNQKKCIEAFYLKEMKYKAIADLYGMEINKVKSYIQNGKRNLKIKLEKYKSEI